MKLAQTVPPRGLIASTGFPVEAFFVMEHRWIKTKYVCTKCLVRGLEMEAGVDEKVSEVNSKNL